MKLDLITKDIADPFSKENFFRLKRELEAQQLLNGSWQYYEIELDAAGSPSKIKHNLKFTPKDIIFLSVEGDQNLYFNFDQFDKTFLYLTNAGPCRVRFFAGRYDDKAYGKGKKEYPFVAPGTGGSVTQWFTGSGTPSVSLGEIGDFYLDTVTKNVYLKVGISSWALQGDLVDPPGVTFAAALKITRVASVNLLKGDALRAVSNTHVTIADSTLTVQDATVIGFADADTLAGANVTITLMGVINDASFSIFSVNSLLFLDTLGAITDVRPTTGYLTVVGHSLGSGDIFASIQKPVKL